MVESAGSGAYDWKLPYWTPYPVPKGFDPYTTPWTRPEQEAMSFVGACSCGLLWDPR